jgi:hypothetical protein
MSIAEKFRFVTKLTGAPDAVVRALLQFASKFNSHYDIPAAQSNSFTLRHIIR